MKIEKGIKTGPLKLCIYGTEGIGKTTLASHAPAPLFIDLENGSNQLDVSRTEPVPTDWKTLLNQVDYVAKHPDVCDTLVIDTADKAENLCIEYICSRENKTSLGSFGYGTGYQFLSEEFEKLLKNLDECVKNGVNVIVIAHSQLRKFEQPEEAGAYDRYELKLQKRTSPLVKEWCDGLLFCNYKTIVETVEGKKKAYGGDRVIYTTHHPAWDAKNRFGLDEELPLDYKSIDGLLYSKSVTNESLKIDDDFSLLDEDDVPFEIDGALEETLDDPDFTELPSGEIYELMKKSNITEIQIIRALVNIGRLNNEKQTLQDLDPLFIKESIIDKWDSFSEYVKGL